MAKIDCTYSDEIIRKIAARAAAKVVEECGQNKLKSYLITEIIDDLCNGVDVRDDLVKNTFASKFMDYFVDDLVKYENGELEL